MEIFDSIGKRLLEVRERMEMTQSEFAAIAAEAGVPGTTRQSQAKYEKGVAMPSAAYLSVIAAAGADVLYILTGRPTVSVSVARPLPADEQLWLDCYRGWDMPIKRQELARALGLSPTDGPDAPRSSPAGRVGGAYSQHSTGANAVQIGSAGGKVSVKKGR